MQYLGTRLYFIVSKHIDTFIIVIQKKDRPNNMDDDEVIQKYMNENYCGTEYEAIEININYYDTVIL